MNFIKAAIVGVGNMGYAHALTIYAGKVPGMRLAAVCDTDESKRQRIKAEMPDIKIFSDWQDLLASREADALIIAAPHYLHPVIAAGAFDKGWHVLTEKPAGVYAGAVRETAAAAEKSGKVFCIMFNQRTNPLFREARDIVRSGRLGAPKRLSWTVTNWYRTQHYYDSGDWRATWRGEGGGVLLNQAPHNLDLWQWIFGMPESVRADCRVARYHNIEVEDEATIYAEYENGASATFITSTGEFPGTNRLEIAGDLGKLVLEEGRLKWWRLLTPEREFCFASRKDFDKIPFDYEEIVPDENKKESGHLGILINFVGAVLRGEELIAPGYDGINELLISNAAYLSSWQGGRKVTLPPDDREFYGELERRVARSAIKSAGSDGTGGGEYGERWQVRW